MFFVGVDLFADLDVPLQAVAVEGPSAGRAWQQELLKWT